MRGLPPGGPALRAGGVGELRLLRRAFALVWGLKLYLIATAERMPTSCWPAPNRRGERRRFGDLARMRQWIEASYGALKDQCHLERHRARTPAGVYARMAQRLLAMAACI